MSKFQKFYEGLINSPAPPVLLGFSASKLGWAAVVMAVAIIMLIHRSEDRTL